MPHAHVVEALPGGAAQGLYREHGSLLPRRGQGLRAGARQLHAELRSRLWARAGSVTQAQVDAINQLYSKGRTKGTRLLWELTGEICRAGEILPPMFFWSLAERDAREGRDCSRVFVRMVTNILLHLAAVDDDVSYAEAEFITDCADRALRRLRLRGRQALQERAKRQGLCHQRRALVHRQAPRREQRPALRRGRLYRRRGEEKPAEKPDFDKLMAELDSLTAWRA